MNGVLLNPRNRGIRAWYSCRLIVLDDYGMMAVHRSSSVGSVMTWTY